MDKKDVRVQIQQMQAEMQALIQSAKKDQLRFVTLRETEDPTQTSAHAKE